MATLCAWTLLARGLGGRVVACTIAARMATWVRSLPSTALRPIVSLSAGVVGEVQQRKCPALGTFVTTPRG